MKDVHASPGRSPREVSQQGQSLAPALPLAREWERGAEEDAPSGSMSVQGAAASRELGIFLSALEPKQKEPTRIWEPVDFILFSERGILPTVFFMYIQLLTLRFRFK